MRHIINGFNPRSRMGSDFLKNQYNNEIRKFTSRDNDNLTMEKGIPDSCHEQTPCSLPNCSRQIVTSLKIAYFTDFTSSMDDLPANVSGLSYDNVALITLADWPTVHLALLTLCF
jgi:hypothetical protein